MKLDIIENFSDVNLIKMTSPNNRWKIILKKYSNYFYLIVNFEDKKDPTLSYYCTSDKKNTIKITNFIYEIFSFLPELISEKEIYSLLPFYGSFRYDYDDIRDKGFKKIIEMLKENKKNVLNDQEFKIFNEEIKEMKKHLTLVLSIYIDKNINCLNLR